METLRIFIFSILLISVASLINFFIMMFSTLITFVFSKSILWSSFGIHCNIASVLLFMLLFFYQLVPWKYNNLPSCLIKSFVFLFYYVFRIWYQMFNRCFTPVLFQNIILGWFFFFHISFKQIFIFLLV